MNRGKIFRRAIFAAFSVIFLLSAAIVGAEIKFYTASGEGYCYETESQGIAKQRAVDKAVKKATKEAGVYLKSYSRTVNSELTDDEVTAITSNAWQLVGEPKFTREIINHSGDTQIIVWTATVEVNVDDSEIQSWIKRDDKDKSQIISQTNEALKASEENDKKIEDLREKYNRATSQAERDSIIKQMNDADKEFLANQKVEEAIKIGSYSGDYEEVIKLYTEAIELKPNWAFAYDSRGDVYRWIRKYDLAIQDYNKAIELNPNEPDYYYHLGRAYQASMQLEQAIQNHDKVIKLNPNYKSAYYFRGVANGHYGLKNYEAAIKDYTKYIELDPNYAETYEYRAEAYKEIKNYGEAIKDWTKYIELEPNSTLGYFSRAILYEKVNNYKAAIKDYTKCIKLSPKDKWYYKNRGECYQKLGDEAKAQADYTKAKELDYEG